MANYAWFAQDLTPADRDALYKESVQYLDSAKALAATQHRPLVQTNLKSSLDYAAYYDGLKPYLK